MAGKAHLQNRRPTRFTVLGLSELHWDGGSPSITRRYLVDSFLFTSFVFRGSELWEPPIAPVLNWENWENSQQNSQLYLIANA